MDEENYSELAGKFIPIRLSRLQPKPKESYPWAASPSTSRRTPIQLLGEPNIKGCQNGEREAMIGEKPPGVSVVVQCGFVQM